METYAEKVARLARERTGEPIFNGSVHHAAVLIERLVGTARREICILSGQLDPAVFGKPRVLDRVSEFLGTAGNKLRVLVEDPARVDWSDHPLVLRIGTSDDLEVKALPEAVRSSVPFHFVVADSESYRFERDKNRTEAIAAFGDHDGAKNLQSVFEDLWKQSAPQELPRKVCA